MTCNAELHSGSCGSLEGVLHLLLLRLRESPVGGHESELSSLSAWAAAAWEEGAITALEPTAWQCAGEDALPALGREEAAFSARPRRQAGEQHIPVLQCGDTTPRRTFQKPALTKENNNPRNKPETRAQTPPCGKRLQRPTAARQTSNSASAVCMPDPGFRCLHSGGLMAFTPRETFVPSR